MDLFRRNEIYIPRDAEVKRIPLQSLPRAVLTGMGLSSSDSESFGKLTDSPEGIWISPAVLRPKGQKWPHNAEKIMSENMSSKFTKEFRAPPEPIPMSFVSSNQAAHKVLRDTVRGVNVSADTSLTSDLPRGPAPQTYQIAVFIHQGRIYLPISKSSHRKRQRETRDGPAASGPATSSASDRSSSSQRKPMTPETALKPARRKTQKKRLRIPLPPGSLKLMSLPKKTTTVNQGLVNGSRPERSKETQGENNTTPQTSSFVPKPPHRVDNQSQSQTFNRVIPEQIPEEAASWNNPGLSATGGGEAANSGQNNIMQTNSQTDSREQSWTRRETQSSSLQQQQPPPCDFKELEQDEKIAQIKARLRQKEAELKNLTK